MNKDDLREEMRVKRRALTNEFVADSSRKILENVFSLEFMKSKKTVCTFLSAFKEPDTIGIIKWLWSENYKVAVPITDTKTETLSLSYIDSMEDLKSGAYGILEPSVIKNANATDIILVPGLAFDRKGGRMGFGKGYYDKLLSENNAVKIGLCYDFQLLDAIPTNSHDVPMDYVITEKEILEIR